MVLGIGTVRIGLVSSRWRGELVLLFQRTTPAYERDIIQVLPPTVP